VEGGGNCETLRSLGFAPPLPFWGPRVWDPWANTLRIAAVGHRFTSATASCAKPRHRGPTPALQKQNC
jgi:hypothetical protein